MEHEHEWSESGTPFCIVCGRYKVDMVHGNTIGDLCSDFEPQLTREQRAWIKRAGVPYYYTGATRMGIPALVEIFEEV